MSKVVRGVKRAVGKVANGIAKVVTKVTGSKTLGKIAKVLAVAATIYFGGAAIMGAVGGATAGAAAGTGWFSGAVSGAGAGIANAWSGLTAASSAAMAGNFSTAGSSLSQGFMGANAAGAGAVTGAQTAASGLGGLTQGGSFNALNANPVTSGAGITAPASVTAPITSVANTSGLVNTAAQQAANPGFWASNTGAATVLAGGQLAGNVIAGAGQAKAAEEQRAYEEAKLAEELARQDENRRVEFQFSAQGEGGNYAPRGESSQYDGTPYRPFPGGPAQLQARAGLIGSQVNTPQGQYGYNFPVFNPALGRYGYA